MADKRSRATCVRAKPGSRVCARHVVRKWAPDLHEHMRKARCGAAMSAHSCAEAGDRCDAAINLVDNEDDDAMQQRCDLRPTPPLPVPPPLQTATLQAQDGRMSVRGRFCKQGSTVA